MPEQCVIELAAWPRHRQELLDVRFQVFVEEQGVPPELEEDGQDPQALHVLARNPKGAVIGTGRLLHDGHIGRMAVMPAYRGTGVGSRLLQALLQHAAQRGITRVFLHAQCSAEGFYRRASFEPVGEVFMDAGIPHRLMRRRIEPIQRT